MRTHKRIVVIAVALVALFAIFSLVWFFRIQVRYGPYVEGLERLYPKTYVLKAEDGYFYNVKLPDYPQFTGNMVVGTPDEKYALLIWPDLFWNKYRYGVQVMTEDKEIANIVVDENLIAEESYMQDIIDKNQKELNKLMEKAKSRWEL